MKRRKTRSHCVTKSLCTRVTSPSWKWTPSWMQVSALDPCVMFHFDQSFLDMNSLCFTVLLFGPVMHQFVVFACPLVPAQLFPPPFLFCLCFYTLTKNARDQFVWSWCCLIKRCVHFKRITARNTPGWSSVWARCQSLSLHVGDESWKILSLSCISQISFIQKSRGL